MSEATDAKNQADQWMLYGEFDLPYPPSVNDYWLPIKGSHRKRICPAGIKFRKAVFAIFFCSQPQPIPGRVKLEFFVTPPDRRKRDLDNVGKALLDALQHGGLYADDVQVDDLRFVRMEPATPGGVKVFIYVKKEEIHAYEK